MQALLEEYEACGDYDETVGCLRSLDAPHYHHELTKRALLAAFEKPDQAPVLLALLRRLADTGVISQVHTYTTCNHKILSLCIAVWHLPEVTQSKIEQRYLVCSP